jgi:uncharacterized integral membrane protein
MQKKLSAVNQTFNQLTLWRETMKKLIVTLIVGALLALPLSVMAMDAVTNAELEGVAGQAGVTIAFGGAATTTISFSAVSWGDPDGLAGTCGNNAGWLIIDGDVTVDQVIACGETLTLDIGTTGAGTCEMPPCSIEIPGGTTFIAVGLPTMALSIDVPSTLVIGLGASSTVVTGTLGILNLRNLSVDAGTPDTLYIWAH